MPVETTSKNLVDKKGLLYLLMFVITLVLILAIGELFSRFFIKLQTIPNPPPISTIDPYQVNPYMFPAYPYIHFHIPGSKYIQARSYYKVEYNINSMGFRGPEILPKSKDLKRLIVIGDSTTEGHGSPFNETFPSLLNINLQQESWEVLNMGVQGGSGMYYAANLKRYLSVFPDAVLIVIFENDLHDDPILESNYLTYPLLDDEDALLMKMPTDTFLTKWRLYTLLQRGWHSFIHAPLRKMVEKNRAIPYTDEEQQAKEVFKQQSYAGHLIAPAIFDKEWRKAQVYLDYVVSAFRQRGISVMVANLALVGSYFSKPHRQHTSSLNENISQWAKENKVPFLSLLPMISNAFEEHSHSEIMIKDDGHPTPLTHSLIERTLRPWVLENLLNTVKN